MNFVGNYCSIYFCNISSCFDIILTFCPWNYPLHWFPQLHQIFSHVLNEMQFYHFMVCNIFVKNINWWINYWYIFLLISFHLVTEYQTFKLWTFIMFNSWTWTMYTAHGSALINMMLYVWRKSKWYFIFTRQIKWWKRSETTACTFKMS